MAVAKQPGRQPDWNVSAMSKTDDRLKGTIGVAWNQDTGAIQIRLNPFVILDTTKHDILISLFPREYKAAGKPRAGSQFIPTAEYVPDGDPNPPYQETTMKKIWKYVIEPNANQKGPFEMELLVPEGGKPLCVMVQDDKVCVWFEADPKEEGVSFTLYSVGTGWGDLDDDHELTYLGSVQQKLGAGDFVWHIYY